MSLGRLFRVLMAVTAVVVLAAPQIRAATAQKRGSDLRGRSRRLPVSRGVHTPVRRVVVTPTPAQTIGLTVRVVPARPAVSGFSLAQNYPNPFRGSTAISYSLVHPSRVTLRIYSVLGTRVATLIDQFQEPGPYSLQWDGTDDRGHRLGPGVYLYRIDSGDFSKSQKLVIR